MMPLLVLMLLAASHWILRVKLEVHSKLCPLQLKMLRVQFLV